MHESTSPREDGRNRIGARLFALQVLAVVARDCAVRCLQSAAVSELEVISTLARTYLGLNGAAIRRDQLTRHHAQRTEALRDCVGLHVAVVVLARPHKATAAFHALNDGSDLTL